VELYKERWNRFELFAKPHTLADDVTLHTFDLLWNRLILAGTAPNQVRAVVTAVKVEWRWAQSRDLIANAKPLLYRSPGGEKNKAREIPEYTPAEQERMTAQLQPQDGTRWRIAAALLFTFDHGFRSNAFLHLQWPDVDWTTGEVTMIEAYDKRHKRVTRPLTYGALSALLTAKYWRDRLGYTGPWVFFSGQRSRRDGPWTYQAANDALRGIEDRAGVEHIKGRAFHGARRTASGNARKMTGDVALGMFWIGDTDLKQAPKYIKERADEMQSIADQT
jgi:integrase